MQCLALNLIREMFFCCFKHSNVKLNLCFISNVTQVQMVTSIMFEHPFSDRGSYLVVCPLTVDLFQRVFGVEEERTRSYVMR